MTPNPIRVGFVGLSTKGWASMALAPGLLDLSLKDKYKLIAVSTTSEESATATAKKYSEELGHAVKPYWGDSSKIANDPEVDFVVVSVKTPLHKATLDPVIEAGKPFFIEWPGGTNLSQSQAIADSAKAKGIKGIIGLQARQSLVIKKAKEFIDSGRIGQIRSTSLMAVTPREMNMWGPRVSDNAVYTHKKENGATLSDIFGGHFLGAFITLLGQFSTINATGFTVYNATEVVDAGGKPTGQTVESTGFDHVAFNGRLKSGALASLNWKSGYKTTSGRTQLLWEIDGEEGSIRIESQALSGPFLNVRDPALFVNGERIDIQNSGMTANLTRAWEEYAKGEAGDYPTPEDSVEVHKVLDAIERSVKDGVTVSL